MQRRRGGGRNRGTNTTPGRFRGRSRPKTRSCLGAGPGRRCGGGVCARSRAKIRRCANNYAWALNRLERFEEAKALLRKKIPVARRVCGESHDLALRIGWTCAYALCRDPSATLDDLREAVTALEELERTARRVLGGAHPTTGGIEAALQQARAALAARETPSTSA